MMQNTTHMMAVGFKAVCGVYSLFGWEENKSYLGYIELHRYKFMLVSSEPRLRNFSAA